MKTIIRLSNILLCGLLLSCSSDFLNMKPANSTAAEDAITNLKEARTAMNGVYRQFTSSNYYGNLFTMYSEYRGADMVVPMNGRGDGALFQFSHNPDANTYFSTYWAHMYWTLAQINNVIANIESGKVVVEPSEEIDINDIKGQALALRAMVHFDLVRLYGYPYMKDQGASWGAVIVTELVPASAKLQRSTVAQTYTQVEADLNAATPLLKKTKTNGRINYWGAKALLARVSLYKGDFAGAYTHASEVINSGLYSLYETEAQWSDSWRSSFGTESIFEFVVRASENDPGTGSIRRYLMPGYNNGLGALYASDPFLALLGQDPDDFRWTMMDLDELGIVATDVADPDYNRRGWCVKYEMPTGSASMTAHGLPVIRLSEIYLIGAEAALKKSGPDLANAASWLNAIRKRAPNLPLAQASDSDLENKILDERSKELLCEGHRFFDLMRLGKTITYQQTLAVIPPGGRGSTVTWDFHKIVLPIDIAEKRVNPDIYQNAGYEW